MIMTTMKRRLTTTGLFIKLLLPCLGPMVVVVTCFVPSTDRRQSTRRHDLSLTTSTDDTSPSNYDDAYNRREFFQQAARYAATATTTSTCTAVMMSISSRPANARGLVSFPCVNPLLNVYHLMRAGTSLLEEQDIWSTNPLFLTNREAALSETGIQQVQAACRILQDADISPSVIKYSLAASSVDSAMVIRDELKVGQNRLIPEFTFMDPRAIGKWDMRSIAETFPAVVAMDELEAGQDGKGARPPPNTDGTPQDTLADQAIRLRQLMSVLETQFSGDNIILVFPDGSSPALLSAMMAGIPYNKAHVLEFAPGEIRLDVRMAPTLQLYETKLQQTAQAYNALIQKGTVELDRLRSLTDDELVSKKDIMIEEERIAIEEEYQRKEAKRLAKEEEDRQARLTRQRELEISRLQSRGIAVDGKLDDSEKEASVPPLVIGGAFAAYAVVALSSAGQSESIYNNNNNNSSSTANTFTDGTLPGGNPLTNITSVPLSPSGQTSFGSTYNPFADTTFVTNDGTANNNLFSDILDDATTTTLYADTSSLYNAIPKSKDERQLDARNAMKNYLDEDDGGNAWLQVMADIISNDDDANDDEDNLFVQNTDEKDGIEKINGSP